MLNPHTQKTDKEKLQALHLRLRIQWAQIPKDSIPDPTQNTTPAEPPKPQLRSETTEKIQTWIQQLAPEKQPQSPAASPQKPTTSDSPSQQHQQAKQQATTNLNKLLTNLPTYTEPQQTQILTPAFLNTILQSKDDFDPQQIQNLLGLTIERKINTEQLQNQTKTEIEEYKGTLELAEALTVTLEEPDQQALNQTQETINELPLSQQHQQKYQQKIQNHREELQAVSTPMPESPRAPPQPESTAQPLTDEKLREELDQALQKNQHEIYSDASPNTTRRMPQNLKGGHQLQYDNINDFIFYHIYENKQGKKLAIYKNLNQKDSPTTPNLTLAYLKQEDNENCWLLGPPFTKQQADQIVDTWLQKKRLRI